MMEGRKEGGKDRGISTEITLKKRVKESGRQKIYTYHPSFSDK
jgi:hypothetical protein